MSEYVLSLGVHLHMSCDAPGCSKYAAVDAEDARSGRRFLRKEGWKISSRYHRCPDHADLTAKEMRGPDVC